MFLPQVEERWWAGVINPGVVPAASAAGRAVATGALEMLRLSVSWAVPLKACSFSSTAGGGDLAECGVCGVPGNVTNRELLCGIH